MAKEISARFRLPVVAFIITATFIALFGSYITYPRAQSTKNHSRTLQKSVFKDGAKLAIREDTLSTEFLRLNTITGQTGMSSSLHIARNKLNSLQVAAQLHLLRTTTPAVPEKNVVMVPVVENPAGS